MTDIEWAEHFLDDFRGDEGRTEHAHKQAQIRAQIAQAKALEDLRQDVRMLEMANRSIAESMFNILDVLREIASKLEVGEISRANERSGVSG